MKSVSYQNGWHFTDLLARLFLSRLVRGPKGRAFLFNFMADAEESDEGAFDEALTRVRPDVEKMVRRHRDDEERHARLLRECLARTGISPGPVPDELRYIARIERIVKSVPGGSWLTAAGDLGVMRLYAMLELIEERGVARFGLIAEALRRVDPQSAAVVASIVDDEKRHVKYARAISRRYAPDSAILATTLEQFRHIEARAFAEHSAAQLRHAVDADLLVVNPVERLFWKALVLPLRNSASAAAAPFPVSSGAAN